MKKEKELIKVFSGSEASSILLKNRLEEIGIEAIIKNDSPGAFFGVSPQIVDLYIEEGDFEKARSILQDFKKPGKLHDGDHCEVVSGTHAGKTGTVRDLNTSKTGHITITVEQKYGVRFKTLARNVVVSKRKR